MSQKQFYDAIRHDPFPGKLTASQVRGIGSILEAWNDLYPGGDRRYLAYALATAFHETGRKMVPVREGFASNDKEAKAHVTALYNSGRIKHNYSLPHPTTGHSYYGRGQVQLTWYENYLKMGRSLGIDLAGNPDLALDPKIGAKIMLKGMVDGTFTKHRLEDYFNVTGAAPISARAIINGDKNMVHKPSGKTYGVLIAEYFQEFNIALARMDGSLSPRPPQPEPDPVTPPDHDHKRRIAELVELLKAESGAKDVSLIFD